MTSPLSPEAVAQMVADLDLFSRCGDVGVMDRDMAIEAKAMLTTLAAENATLRAENEDAFVRGMAHGQKAMPKGTFHVVDSPELARLRASEAAALERVTVLTDLMQWAYDTLGEINPGNYGHDDVCNLNDKSVEVILALEAALTPSQPPADAVPPLPLPG